ncbi:hypothetical protein BS47DRAFT_1353118, partial [Hydnum rufescens UP504]
MGQACVLQFCFPRLLANLFHRVHTLHTTCIKKNNGLPGREGAWLGRRISGLRRALYW